MFKNPRRGRQAINFTTNVPKILDLKSPSEQIFPKIDVGCPRSMKSFLTRGDARAYHELLQQGLGYAN